MLPIDKPGQTWRISLAGPGDLASSNNPPAKPEVFAFNNGYGAEMLTE